MLKAVRLQKEFQDHMGKTKVQTAIEWLHNMIPIIKKEKQEIISSQEEEAKEKARQYDKIKVLEMLEEDAPLFEDEEDTQTTNGEDRRKRIKLERNFFVLKMTEI